MSWLCYLETISPIIFTSPYPSIYTLGHTESHTTCFSPPCFSWCNNSHSLSHKRLRYKKIPSFYSSLHTQLSCLHLRRPALHSGWLKCSLSKVSQHVLHYVNICYNVRSTLHCNYHLTCQSPPLNWEILKVGMCSVLRALRLQIPGRHAACE